MFQGFKFGLLAIPESTLQSQPSSAAFTDAIDAKRPKRKKVKECILGRRKS